MLISSTKKNSSLCVLFFISPNDSFSKATKNVFHLKISFSQDIQIFLFLSSLLFLSVSHCFRGWWKGNLKVSGVISCLHENIITHCVPKTSLKPLNFGKKTQSSHCMQEILLKIRYFGRGLSKSLRRVKFIFSFESSL